MKAIIPTGGRGTRMQPITFSSNKHFIPLANKPLIYYPIETIVAAGIKEIGITYNPGWLPQVQKTLGDGNKWGVKFTFILQEEPKGLANIIQVCEDFIAGDSFVFHLGDNIFFQGLEEQIRFFENEKPTAMVVFLEHEDNKRLGVPLLEGDKLKKYIEKPENPPNNFAIPGAYFFDGKVFDCFKGENAIKPSARGELEISEPFNWLIDHGFEVLAKEYKGVWLDPGKLDDWLETNRYILDESLDTDIKSATKESVIESRVKIGENCQIENCEIRGPVVIGDNVRLENSYVGPYTSIYNGCEIVGSHLENSVLMEGVKISNVDRPIDASVIGSFAEVSNNITKATPMRLYIGEKSKIIL